MNFTAQYCFDKHERNMHMEGWMIHVTTIVQSHKTNHQNKQCIHNSFSTKTTNGTGYHRRLTHDIDKRHLYFKYFNV